MTVMGKTQKNSTDNFSKHMSKKQKKKVKFEKKGKKEFKATGKRGRLVVRNLPFKCNANELQKHFSPFGDIKDIHLLRRHDNKLVGCGFVEYSSRLNADKAIEGLNGKPFLGRPIYIERAVARERYGEGSKEDEKETSNGGDFVEDEVKNEFDESEIKEEPESDEEDSSLDTSKIKQEESSSGDEEEKHVTGNKNTTTEYAKTKVEVNKNVKNARVIVRNLSFKATEEELRSHFCRFGEITEVVILRRQDNSPVGCAFLQFTKKQSATKAIHHTSGKPFLGRPIIVDWAIPKDKFKKMQEEAVTKEIKKENESDETKPFDVSEVSAMKTDDSDEDSEAENERESESSESEEEEGSSDDEEDEEAKPVKQEAENSRKRRIEDVDEGKTVFVKNLPFSVTDEDFRECMEQYGPLFYALVCKDKLTEHSKGSGFVKFKNKEDAEKCLSAGTELTLKGTILDPHPALKRDDAQKLKDKSKEKKDNRNLYLAKEGMIIAGTPAARGVSVADMERRLQLEQWKTSRLRNLNMFVSRNRLVIHNLPVTLSDKQLLKLFQKHTSPKAIIKETRVMRDLKHVDAKGKGTSKAYGFVSFEKHEDALKAVRSINNNPNIFTPTMRPIVAFSIENRTVLNSKTKRMVRSQQKNPLCKDYKPEEAAGVATKKAKFESSVKDEQSEPEFAGIATKPGASVKMRQKYKLKNQVQQHVQDVRKQKREMKISRKMRRTDHIKKKQYVDQVENHKEDFATTYTGFRHICPKVGKKAMKKTKTNVDNDSAFTNLVDKYKLRIMSQTNEKKKWYNG